MEETQFKYIHGDGVPAQNQLIWCEIAHQLKRIADKMDKPVEVAR